jgi:PRTRC genetic system ThiF family protein
VIKKQEKWHFTAPYILNPQHPVTINVIGAGGSGSQMLNQLARIDQALKKIGHTGLHVTCFDNDEVTEANLGRQLFSPVDIGMNKAVVLITRLNMFFGTSWSAIPKLYSKNTAAAHKFANITISCVDNIDARKVIEEILLIRGSHRLRQGSRPYNLPYYWIDLGNAQTHGQFVIGSIMDFEQPKKSATLRPVKKLLTVFEKFPHFAKQKTKDTGPSCSLAEALSKQDLFVNSFLAQTAAHTLWRMFREGKINYHGAFINLKTLDIAPIYL